MTQQQKGTSPRQTLLEKQAMIRNEKKSNRPDEALARLAANGNAATFDEIYSRHISFVYNVALRMTGNTADAEDLTQESFVSVLCRVCSFRGEASFTTWLYRIVINQVKMFEEIAVCPACDHHRQVEELWCGEGEVLPSVERLQQKYKNNRGENSHRPTRLRERAMGRF